jgi:hypothetical protein
MISSRLNVLAVQHPSLSEIRTAFRQQMLNPISTLDLRVGQGVPTSWIIFQNEKTGFQNEIV